ncbi:MAG: heparinase II/III family protein [Candidatus Kapabacteria bacterium]|nr:heparinase II/III family protein [Candidatus Kapabacteria bacterium]
MKLPWKVRVVFGPMRPFLLLKFRDAIRERVLSRRLRSFLPVHAPAGSTLLIGVTSLPSEGWFAQNSAQVLAFAERMRDGTVEAYGIEHWRVGQSDPIDVDVRSIHELSRMHHWCAYALAAHIDADHRDAWCELLRDEIETFMRTTPAEVGVHWEFPMGTALRLHSILVAWDWARRSGWSNAQADNRILGYAADHAACVVARRESRGGLSTSHYAANLLGILAAGRYINGYAPAERWYELATRELQRELTRQLLPDGMANEASTGYHRQVTDIFVQASSLMTFTPEQRQRIVMAVECCRVIEHIGMPLIGDNDDGLAMKLTGFAPDLSYLCDVATRTCGKTETKSADSILPDFGLTIRHHAGLLLTLRNGHVGQFGKGGHAHNDQNSITVSVGGFPLIVDPGTSCYTSDPEQRNSERSARSHATMWSTSAEQCYSPDGEEGLFWLLEDETHVSVKSNTNLEWHGIVAHTSGRNHSRRVTFIPNGIECLDEYTHTAQSSEHAEVVFPLALGVGVHIENNTAMLKGPTATAVLTWSSGEMRVEPITLAPEFGRTVLSQCLRLRTKSVHWTLALDTNP